MSCTINPFTGFGLADPGKVSTPSAKSVGGQYLNLLGAFKQGMPTELQLQEQYQPQFTALDLQNVYQSLVGGNGTPGYLDIYSNNVVPTVTAAQTAANTATRAANINDVATLSPSALAALRTANPAQAALMDTLTKTATDQLKLGTTIDPDTANNITSAVRANWSNRGLGDSAPAQLDEALQLYGGGQNLLSSRQAEAGNVASLNANLYTDPLLSMIGVGSNAPDAAQNLTATGANVGASAGPTIFPENELSSLFSTVYNANAAANTATANNRAAICGDSIEAGGQLAGGAIGAFA